ncbi:twin-arginine translocation signal domain-containing protein, partial [Streptomyces sp. SID5606]
MKKDQLLSRRGLLAGAACAAAAGTAGALAVGLPD